MDGYKLFQLSAPISHGSSGSPVLNTKGEVVGIVNAMIEEGQNLNFAVPTDYTTAMMNSREILSLADSYEPADRSERVATTSPTKSVFRGFSDSLEVADNWYHEDHSS
jgi:S1-C subfamily serine protease